MKLKSLLLATFSLLLVFCSCKTHKPVATTHTERIEQHVMPIPVSADTIEITLCRDARLERPLTREGQNPTSTASSNLCKSDERLLTKSKQRIEKELKNQSDLCNLWETPHSEGVNSVRNKNNSVRIKSTRGVSVQTTHTDTTSTLRITLRPDTVYVPYTTHIRSDTIVAPDPTTVAKLTSARWKMALLIILMLLIIVYRLRPLLYR